MPPGAGHFQRFANRWLVQHAGCAIKYRGTKHGYTEEMLKQHEIKLERERAQRIERWKIKARQTGKPATKARKRLKDLGLTW